MKQLNRIVLLPYYFRLRAIKKQIQSYKNSDIDESGLISLLKADNMNKRIAAAVLIIENTIGLTLHDEQLIAVMAMLDNKFVDVKTGEGKTIIVAAFCLIASKPIHVVTVNEYLAQYAVVNLSELYTKCGISVDILYDEASKNKEDVFSADIVYGTANAFCFKYVIDRFSRKLDYTLNIAVIDEADYVCIDNATSSCSVGVSDVGQETHEIIAFDVARKIKEYLDLCKVFRLTYDEEICWNRIRGKDEFQMTIFVCKELNFIDFSQDIIDDLYMLDTNGLYEGPEIISFAVGLATAMFIYEKMVDYMVVDNKILLIDQHNGRILPNSKHEFYLNIGLLVKENIFVLEEQKTIGSIAIQVYFLKYKTAVGLSGSLAPVKDEIFSVFRAKTAIIPKHIPGKVYEKEIFAKSMAEKYRLLKAIVQEETSSNRPVLVITKDDHYAKKVSSYLRSFFPNVSTFNNEESYENEQMYVDQAGNPAQITVSTLLFGRGTDITPKNNSDLVVVMFEDYGCPRLKIQIAGRTGRQGGVGRVYTLISPEDFIFQTLTENEKKKINSFTFRYYAKKSVGRIQSTNYAIREYSSYFEYYFDLVFDYYFKKVRSSFFDDLFLSEMEGIKLHRFSNQSKEDAVLKVMKEADKMISTIIYNIGGEKNA